jgi:hypothetical protein
LANNLVCDSNAGDGLNDLVCAGSLRFRCGFGGANIFIFIVVHIEGVLPDVSTVKG